jgi:phosphatidylglycerophosphate synthase
VPVGFRAALTALRRVQKSPKGVSSYSIVVNRPAGRVLAATAHALGMSAHGVTLLSGLSSAAGIAVLALAPMGLVSAVAAALLLVLGYALDSADGQLSRLQGTGGPAGEWLDHVLDCAVKLALHMAVLVAWYGDGVRGPLLLLPIGFQLVTVLTFFAGTLAGLLLGGTAPTTEAPVRSGLWLLPVDYGVLCWGFLLWASTPLFRLWYGGLLAVQVLYLLVFLVHWWRRLRALT